MSMGELIFVILLAGGFLIPPLLAHQRWLLGVFGMFFACFGVIEFLAVKTTGETVSQKFWKLKRTKPKLAWLVIGGMIMGWAALLAHFIFHS